jgi:hypothetical protein
MATIIINETAIELLTRAVAHAGQGDEASAISEALGTVDRETYLGLLACWRAAYTLKAAEIRKLKADRGVPVPKVPEGVSEEIVKEAKRLRERAILAKADAHSDRCDKRHEARRLMEVRASLKHMARAHAAVSRPAA